MSNVIDAYGLHFACLYIQVNHVSDVYSRHEMNPAGLFRTIIWQSMYLFGCIELEMIYNAKLNNSLYLPCNLFFCLVLLKYETIVAYYPTTSQPPGKRKLPENAN